MQKDDLYRFQQIVGLHREDKAASVAKVLVASVARLEEQQRHLWQDLSVYDRSFGLEAAQAMQAEATLEDLYLLVDRSLIQELPGQQFEFLSLIQQFAQQQAATLAPAHQKATHYYQRRCLPLQPDTLALALADYLGVFYHTCELGQYLAAWTLMQQRTVEDEQQGRYSSCEMFLKFQGSGSDRLKLQELYERLVERWHPQTPQEQTLFADALQAIGDVLQFLDQRSEALNRYDEALLIYRDVGARLGEANTLLGLGSLQDDPRQAINYYMNAREIFEQIGDKYSQGRNLLMFIVKAQLQQKDLEGTMHSPDRASAIGDEIGFELFRQVVDQIRAELPSEPTT